MISDISHVFSRTDLPHWIWHIGDFWFILPEAIIRISFASNFRVRFDLVLNSAVNIATALFVF